MKTYIWPATPINTAGLATEAKQDAEIAAINQLNNDNTAQNSAELAELQTFHSDNTNQNADIFNQVKDLNTNNSAENAATLAELSSFKNNTTSENATIIAKLQTISDASTAAFFTKPYDTLQVTASTVNGPTTILSRVGGLGGSVQQTLNIVYDGSGNFQSGVVS